MSQTHSNCSAANHERKPYDCYKKKFGKCKLNRYHPTMCIDEMNYYINRSHRCVYMVLEHLFLAKLNEDQMAAFFDYLLSSTVQLYLNTEDEIGEPTTPVKYFRQEIIKILGYYNENPPDNNKYASDLKEMEAFIKLATGTADPEPRTMSDKSKDILHPITSQLFCQYPDYELYNDEHGEPYDNFPIQGNTRHSHFMDAANTWMSYADHEYLGVFPTE